MKFIEAVKALAVLEFVEVQRESRAVTRICQPYFD